MYKTLIISVLLLLPFSAVAIDSVVITKKAVEKSSMAQSSSRFSISHNNMQSDDLGLNVSLLDENDMQFITMDCDKSLTSLESECPLGNLSWMKSNLLGKTNNHHGIGIFINSEKALLAKLTDREFKSDDSIVYEYGLAYNYYINNANQDGFNFAAHVYRYNDKRIGESIDNSGINLHVGYQF
mgnify:FL=1